MSDITVCYNELRLRGEMLLRWVKMERGLDRDAQQYVHHSLDPNDVVGFRVRNPGITAMVLYVSLIPEFLLI